MRRLLLALSLAVFTLGAGISLAQGPEPVDTNAVVSAADVVKEDMSAAVKGLAHGDLSAATPMIEKYVIPAGSALLILIVAYLFGKFLARVASKPVRKRVDETLGVFVGKLVFATIMIFALLGVLGKFGVSVASFAAVIGAAGLAVGLAFQGTLSNFAAGILLLVFRPYKVGDVISAGGITAKVMEIDLFTTVFDTPDNRRIIVPNGQVSGGTIENITHHTERRVDVVVGVDYPASIDKTREVLTAAAESLKDSMVAGDDRGFQIVLGDLGDSAVGWTVRFWTKTEDYWGVKEALTQAVKDHLDQACIGIPYPQMDVHVFKSE